MSKKPEKFENTGVVRLPVLAERSIGGILLDSGKITAADAERALRLQKEEGLRFGEACIRLGLVTSSDIEWALSDQFRYPYLRPGEGNVSSELAAAHSPFSIEVEQLRAVRTQLLLRWFTPERKMLAVVSPARRDGRSRFAANLAVVFSQLGEDTLLIDGDMRQPRQHQMFNLPNRVGLSAVLSGRGGMECIERIAHFANLSVLTVGALPPNPLELLSREEFFTLLDQVKRRYDVILIDTPAAVLGTDAQTIAIRAGGALMVAREGQTRIKDLHSLGRTVSNDTEIVGSVFNRF